MKTEKPSIEYLNFSLTGYQYPSDFNFTYRLITIHIIMFFDVRNFSTTWLNWVICDMRNFVNLHKLILFSRAFFVQIPW